MVRATGDCQSPQRRQGHRKLSLAETCERMTKRWGENMEESDAQNDSKVYVDDSNRQQKRRKNKNRTLEENDYCTTKWKISLPNSLKPIQNPCVQRGQTDNETDVSSRRITMPCLGRNGDSGRIQQQGELARFESDLKLRQNREKSTQREEKGIDSYRGPNRGDINLFYNGWEKQGLIENHKSKGCKLRRHHELPPLSQRTEET